MMDIAQIAAPEQVASARFGQALDFEGNHLPIVAPRAALRKSTRTKYLALGWLTATLPARSHPRMNAAGENID